MNERETAMDTAIRALASEPPRRARRSRRNSIFRTACDTAETLVRAWTQDAEFARLIGSPAHAFTAGVAVEPELFAAIRSANGAPRLADVPPEQDALEFHLNFGNDVRLEVLTTRGASGEGAVARYLRKFGRNVQHVEIATSDVGRAAEILKTRFALQPIYPASAPGRGPRAHQFFPGGKSRRKEDSHRAGTSREVNLAPLPSCGHTPESPRR
jgi:hypothetical protein